LFLKSFKVAVVDPEEIEELEDLFHLIGGTVEVPLNLIFMRREKKNK